MFWLQFLLLRLHNLSHSALPPCSVGDELECIQPSVYRNVARQLNISVAMESMVSDAFIGVATEIFSTGTCTLLFGFCVDVAQCAATLRAEPDDRQLTTAKKLTRKTSCSLSRILLDAYSQ